ncbi:sec23/sec24 transport family protein [Tanacetum coccineum]
MESQFQSLKEEMPEMHKNYNNRGGNQASKDDDTLMCERHEANYIKSEDLNNDVKNDLEDFKRCVRSMRTVHSKLYERDGQSKTDLEKIITKFLDGQRVANMYVKKNVNDMIIKMKQNENNSQNKIKNMERKLYEWSKSQNVSSEQTDSTDPPPPQARIEQVNALFTASGKSDDSPKIQKDPPPPMIVNNKTEKD